MTKTGNLKLEIQCTNQPQQWHRRGRKGNPKHYTPVNKVDVKSAKVSRETNAAKKIKSVPVKRNLHEKVEQMSKKLNAFEVERHFLLTIGQNKTLRAKGGLYPLLADRYITQSALGDHDYCQPPSSSVDKEPVTTRNFYLPAPSCIPMPQTHLAATEILYYPVQQRSVQWYHLRKKPNYCLSNWRPSRHCWNKQI